MRQRGFTLIEMIAVMVIMAVLAVVALSRFNPSDYQLSAARDELVGVLRHAQELSLSHTGDSGYQVSLSASGYTLTHAGAPVPNPVTGEASYVSNWDNVGLDTTGTISFDGYGEPQLSGLAWSGNQLVVTVSVGNVSDTLRIERLTGYVR